MLLGAAYFSASQPRGSADRTLKLFSNHRRNFVENTTKQIPSKYDESFKAMYAMEPNLSRCQIHDEWLTAELGPIDKVRSPNDEQTKFVLQCPDKQFDVLKYGANESIFQKLQTLCARLSVFSL